MTPRTLPPLAQLGRALGILAALCLLSVPAALGMLTATLYTLAAVVLALVVIAATTALHRAEARRAWRATLHRIDSERRTR